MIFGTMNDTSYRQRDEAVILHASVRSDSVVSPVTGRAHTSVAFLYQRMKGDFILQAEVSQHSLSTYNTPALMAMESEAHWVEACFEYTDLYTRVVVSVITDITSDDCDEVEIDGDLIWLQLCCKNHIFATHCSLNGVHRRMHHILRMEVEGELKVNLMAQGPPGDGEDFIFEKVSLKPERKVDIRGGN